MAFSSKLLLTAVSAAATAYASGCSVASTTTISSGAEASAVGGCSTFTGSIVIETGVASAGSLNLDSIKKLDGGLTYQNDNTTQTFSMQDLQTITGTLILANMSSLSTINLNSLTSAANIVFSGLGALGSLGFADSSGSGGLQEAGDVTIQNTHVTDLVGLDTATKLDGLSITDNGLLSNITFALDSVTTVIIGPNDVSSESGVMFSMPNLKTADHLTVQNCSSVNIPKLENVQGNLELIGNTFDNFTASKISWVGGLVIANNIDMKNMSFPALTAVNGSNSTLSVTNNTKLMDISGFDLLKEVDGDVNLVGNFSDLSFPKLGTVGGALKIDTASSTFDCSKLPDSGSQIVAGETSCHIGDKTKVGGSSTGTETSSSSSSFAFAQEIPAGFMPIFPLIAGLLFA